MKTTACNICKGTGARSKANPSDDCNACDGSGEVPVDENEDQLALIHKTKVDEVEKAVDNLIRLTKERMDRVAVQTPAAAHALSPAGPNSSGAVVNILHMAQNMAYDQIRLNALLEVKAIFSGKKKRSMRHDKD